MRIHINDSRANIFNIMCEVRQDIPIEKSKEMLSRVMQSRSYETAIQIINEYAVDKVEIIE